MIGPQPTNDAPGPTQPDSELSLSGQATVPHEIRGASPEAAPKSTAIALAERYEDLTELGRGGMGIVYRARDRETGDVVAVKVLRPDIAAQADVVERFKAELRLARKVTHKSACRMYELLRLGDTVAIAMEYVEGETLRSYLRRYGSVPLRRGLEWTEQICSALGEAHGQSVVHRDLKPENIMIARDGTAKVMDFGIARSFAPDASQTTAIAGTPAYMSPEHASGKPADQRSDIYSLGLVLYEMFTGRAAVEADNAVALAMKQIHETPPAPRDVEPLVPDFIARAIEKCLAKKPAKRFQSVAELAAALRQSGATPEPATADAEPTAPDSVGRWRGSDAVVLGLGLLGMALFVRFLAVGVPESQVRIAVDKHAAQRIARETLAKLGLDAREPVYSNVHWTWDAPDQTLWRVPAGDLPSRIAGNWSLCWGFRTEGPSTWCHVRSNGRPRFLHVDVPAANQVSWLISLRGRPRVTRDEQRNAADSYIGVLTGLPLSELRPRENGTSATWGVAHDAEKVDVRDFTWRPAGERPPDWDTEYRLSLAGTKPVRFVEETIENPEQAIYRRRPLLPYGIEGSAAVLLLLSTAVAVLGRAHLRLGWRAASATAFLAFSAAVGAPVAENLVTSVGISLFFAAFSVIGLAAAGYLVRSVRPDKCFTLDHLLAVSHRAAVGRAVVRGVLVGCAAAGAYASSRAVGFWLSWPHAVPLRRFEYLRNLTSDVGGLLTILESLWFGVVIFVVLGLFFGLLHRLTAQELRLALLVPLCIGALGVDLDAMSRLPAAWFDVLTVYLLGFGLVLTLLRFDAVTLMAAGATGAFLLRNTALWSMTRAIGNLQYTLAFVVWGSLTLVACWAAFQREVGGAFKGLKAAFE
jgi:hypothetical protein